MWTNSDSFRLPLDPHFNKYCIDSFGSVEIDHTEFLETILKQKISLIETKIQKLNFVFEIHYHKFLYDFIRNLMNYNLIKLAFP